MASSLNLKYREEYPLASNGENAKGRLLIKATFFGMDSDDQFVFYREKKGEVLRYTVPIGSRFEIQPGRTVYFGLYRGYTYEPSGPFLNASFEGEVKHDLEKEYILERLRNIEARVA